MPSVLTLVSHVSSLVALRHVSVSSGSTAVLPVAVRDKMSCLCTLGWSRAFMSVSSAVSEATLMSHSIHITAVPSVAGVGSTSASGCVVPDSLGGVYVMDAVGTVSAAVGHLSCLESGSVATVAPVLPVARASACNCNVGLTVCGATAAVSAGARVPVGCPVHDYMLGREGHLVHSDVGCLVSDHFDSFMEVA